LLVSCHGIATVCNCHTFCLRSFSTLQTNDSLQQELLKMQEKIDLIQKKLEIVIKLTEIEKINAPI